MHPNLANVDALHCASYMKVAVFCRHRKSTFSTVYQNRKSRCYSPL